MLDDLNSSIITLLHDRRLADEHRPSEAIKSTEKGGWKWIEQDHQFNCLLWDEEDQARRNDVPDSAVAANKRAIDGYNQKRNDSIEKIDESILERLENVTLIEDAWFNSETAGSIIDRLSILSLKIYHMTKQAERDDVDQLHIVKCEQKAEILKIQRHNLASCLDRLLGSATEGRAYFKIYRQYKMYNDPRLNPYLSGMKNGSRG